MSITVNGLDELKKLAGGDLGTSEWIEVTQERVNTFADATGDHQWIHVDRERCARESPFGVPVAHGYFTVSRIAGLFFEACEIRGFALTLNYGLNKVRFPSPLKLGARYRLALKLLEVKDIPKGAEAIIAATIEIEGEPKPACVAEVVFRLMQG
jgi:acyl dehydratase